MEVTELQAHPEHGSRRGLAGDPFLSAGELIGRQSRQLNALNLLQGKDGLGGRLPINLWKPDGWIVCKESRQTFCGTTFMNQVELDLNVPGKLLDNFGRAKAEVIKVPLGKARQVTQDVEISLDDSFHSWADDLDHYGRPVNQRRTMDLGNRGGCQRGLRDRREDFVIPFWIGFIQARLDVSKGHLGNVILQFLELIRHFLGDEVRPGAEHLAQLDEGRAQFLTDDA